MASSVQIPVTQTGLEASIQAALKNAGKNATINLGANARQINALSQPLGRITGQADEFTKSMEAANARVFAFGASVGIINAVSNAFSALVKNTIAVEKSLVEINTVLGTSSSELDKFGGKLFEVAKNTGQSFEAVSKGALELARQGLGTEETLRRINDALILTRLSGLDAGKSVEGLTAAVNSFKSTGITTSEVLNKLVNVSQKYAVSEKDLIEGLKRSSSVAKQAGVSFDELVGVITAVQEKSAVGGAVIGTSFKTIFSRLQKRDTLDALQQLGVEVADVQGKILPATRLLENLAVKIKSLDQIQIAQITEKVGGGYQIDKLISALDDMGSKGSIAFEATKISAEAANEAYAKNAALNKTLANLINETTLSAQELGATLGKLGITDNAKNLLGFFNSLLESIQKVLGEESAIGDVFRGLAKGIGNLITGPGLALFGAIILKLSKDLAQFGFSSLKSFFGIGKAAKEIEAVEKSVANALSTNIGLQRQLFALEGNRAAQIKVMTDAIVQQEAAMRRMASTSSSLAGPLYQAGVRGTNTGLRVPKAAGGYMPAVAQESSDINRGVGGARSGDRPVVIPNFNFGGGQRGSMVAHTGEYAVPNFAGSGGTAIFNRDMVRSMGLPSGAKKINAAGGLIPNFAKVSEIARYFDSTVGKRIEKSESSDGRLSGDDTINLVGNGYKKLYVPKNKGETENAYEKRIIDQYKYIGEGMFNGGNSAVDGFKGGTSLLEVKSGGWDVSDVKLKFLRANAENYGQGIPLDIWTKNKDNIKVSGLLIHSDESDKKNFVGGSLLRQDLINSDKYRSSKYSRPRKIDDTGKYIKNLSSGFIPNFAKLPTTTSDDLRRYAQEGDLEQYRREGTYFFPNGTQRSVKQVEDVLSRGVAKATINKQAAVTKREEEMQKKGAIDFFIDANSLGGIALVTPSRRGSSGTLSAESKILNLPQKPDGVLMDDRLVIKNIQSTGVPAKKDFEQISGEINKLFAGPIVSLAQSLYGKLYSGASGSEFASQLGQLRSTSKGGILPPGAEGQIFEAAGKAALTSMNQIASAFDPSKENRPFDFTNATSMKEMLGVKAVRGDAKRAGGSEKQFKETVNGLVKKSINDPQLKSGIFSQIKQQSRGRVLPENASGGYIPNFVSQSRRIGFGAEASFLRLGSKGGMDVGVKKFYKDGPKNALSQEWLISQYINRYLDIPGIYGPKTLSGFNESNRRGGIRKEIISGKLGKVALGYDKGRYFGLGTMRSAVKTKGLDLPDLHGANYILNSNAEKYLSGMSNYPTDAVGSLSLLRDMASKGGVASIIDPGFARLTGSPAIDVVDKMLNYLDSKKKTASGGYVPNFVDLTKSEDFTKNQRKRSSKARTYRTASGVIGSLFKSLLDKFFSDKILGDAGQGLETDSILDLIKNNSLYVASFAGPKAVNFVLEAEKYGLKVTKGLQNKLASLATKAVGKFKGFSSGFLPNFADPLKEAVGREMAAGVPSSQIYIDKNQSLKSAANPMGLMVANRRDEPAGGHQGISRAIKEGRNPKTYGAANGFVPNYVAGATTGLDLTPFVGKTVPQAQDKIAKDLNDTLDRLNDEYRKQLSNLKETTKNIEEKLKTEKELVKIQRDELAKYIKAIRKSKGQGGDALKIAEAEQQAKNKKSEIVTTNQSILNNQSKLDRIQSGDALKNLATNRKNQEAQAKSNASAMSSAVAANAKRGFGNPITPRVVDPSIQKKSGVDIGTVFALQGAMSVLTGVTDGATSKMGLFSNSLANTLSNVTAVSFGFQALKGLAPEGTKTANVLGKLGGAGMIAYAAFEGIKLLFKSFKIWNGDIERSAVAIASFNDKLNGFLLLEKTKPQNEEEKVKSAKETENLIKNAEYDIYDKKLTGGLGSQTDVAMRVLGAATPDFIGKNTIMGLSKYSVASVGAVSDMSSGNRLTSDKEFNSLIENIRKTKLIDDKTLQKLISNIKESSGNNAEEVKQFFSDFAKNQISLSNSIFSEIQKRADLPELSEIEKKLPIEKQRELINADDESYVRSIVGEDEALIKASMAYLQAAREFNAYKKNQQSQEELLSIPMVDLEKTKIQLNNTIELAVQRERINDVLDKELKSSQILGNYSQKQIDDLEYRIQLRDNERELADKTKGFIQDQINKLKDLGAAEKVRNELNRELSELNTEQLTDQDAVKRIVQKINEQLGINSTYNAKQKENNEVILQGYFDQNEAKKKGLELSKDELYNLKEQATTLKDIVSSAQRASQQRSFGIDIASRRSQFSNTKQITELQASKLGKSTSEIKIIDAQIAAIEANTVALENVANYNKMLEDKRGELLGLAKFQNKEQALIFEGKLTGSKDIKDLEKNARTAIGMQGIDPDAIEAIKKFIQNLQQESEKLQLDSESAQAAADARAREAGAIEPVISALEMFRRSLLGSTNIIDQRIQDLELEKLTSISGRRNAEINYEIETLNQQKGKSAEEAAKIARDRQNKKPSQLLSEAFSTTEEERSMNLKNSIVDASVQFKNNMIDGISEAIEGGKSLGDVLQNSAYEFVKAINKQLMSNLVDSVVGSGKQDASGGSGFLGNIMSSIGLASGGKVNGGSGAKDDVPAMLMGGEYVINKKSVQKYGPQFLEALNNGTIGGYAKGGKVQSGKGGFFTPGTYGLGGIEGTRNLLQFATQGYTSGARDIITNAAGYQSIALEPESARLTNFGRSNSPQAEATRAAKEQAFGLYTQEINAQMEAAKQAEAEKDAFKKQLIMLGISAVGGAVMKAGSAGFNNVLKSGGSLTEAFKGVWSGSGGFGGLKNLFSGNFAASQVGSNKELAEYILNNSDTGTMEALRYSSELTGVKNYTTPNTQSNYNIASDTGSYEASDDLLPPKRATGGTIPSRGGIDTVPAMLSGGEFIMNRSAAQNIGAGNLQALNAGAGSIVTEEKTEELNDKLIAKLDELIEASGGGGSITINVEGSGGATNQTTSGQTSEQKQQLARQIKDAVVKVIQEEKRLGGSLRR